MCIDQRRASLSSVSLMTSSPLSIQIAINGKWKLRPNWQRSMKNQKIYRNEGEEGLAKGDKRHRTILSMLCIWLNFNVNWLSQEISIRNFRSDCANASANASHFDEKIENNGAIKVKSESISTVHLPTEPKKKKARKRKDDSVVVTREENYMWVEIGSPHKIVGNAYGPFISCIFHFWQVRQMPIGIQNAPKSRTSRKTRPRCIKVQMQLHKMCWELCNGRRARHPLQYNAQAKGVSALQENDSSQIHWSAYKWTAQCAQRNHLPHMRTRVRNKIEASKSFPQGPSSACPITVWHLQALVNPLPIHLMAFD